MSGVLFAATVAARAGIDVLTAERVITSLGELIRDMALAGSGVSLTGVGSFKVAAGAGAHRRLTFKPTARLARIAP